MRRVIVRAWAVSPIAPDDIWVLIATKQFGEYPCRVLTHWDGSMWSVGRRT